MVLGQSIETLDEHMVNYSFIIYVIAYMLSCLRYIKFDALISKSVIIDFCIQYTSSSSSNPPKFTLKRGDVAISSWVLEIHINQINS